MHNWKSVLSRRSDTKESKCWPKDGFLMIKRYVQIYVQTWLIKYMFDEWETLK